MGNSLDSLTLDTTAPTVYGGSATLAPNNSPYASGGVTYWPGYGAVGPAASYTPYATNGVTYWPGYGAVGPAGESTSAPNILTTGDTSGNLSLDQALSQLTSAQTTPQNISYPTLNLNPDWFQVPDMNSYVKAAFNDPSLVQYYTQVLQDAQGDVNRAIDRLKQDYQQGLRYTSQDVDRLTTQEKEDLSSSLKTLGLQFSGETQNLLDTLNRRGMAVTQAQAGPGAGPLATGTGGRGGYEMGQLGQSQALRQEAVQRTADRNLQNIGISAQRQVTSLGQTQTRGIEDWTRALQEFQTQQLKSREQEAQQIGSQQQSMAMAQKQLDLQKAQLEQANALYGGTGSSSSSSVNPNDAGSIKSAFPGYAGWNDPNAIIQDYAKTQGAGKQ